jgi:hypothetical protein
MPVQEFFLEYNKAREVMRIAVKRCINIEHLDARNNTVLHQQSLFPLLGKRRMSLCFNQEASGVFLPQVGMCAIPQTACNTPPQVDTSTYRNITRATGKGEEKTHAFLALPRPFVIFLSTSAQLAFGSDQRNDGDKAKPGQKKPDKGKSQSDKQSDREQQEKQKPKTKG